jgi:hypothetical protein
MKLVETKLISFENDSLLHICKHLFSYINFLSLITVGKEIMILESCYKDN